MTASDLRLSPKKALRAVMLKSRFADTILKAKQKRLLDHVIQLSVLDVFSMHVQIVDIELIALEHY